MKTRQGIIIILTLITVVMTQVLPVYGADAPIIQVSAQNIYLTAGQENTIKIVLSNTGDYKVFDVEAFLSSATSGLTVLTKANNVFTEIAADKSRSYEATIYVDQSVGLGAYSLSLTVSYGRTGSTLAQTITVPIGVVISEVFTPKISYAPRLEAIEVKSGTLNNVEFSFVNNWEQAIDELEIILGSSTSSITIRDGISTSVDIVEAGESFTISPTLSIIEGTTLGTYTISATASYKDADGIRYHQTFTLPINVASAAAVRTTLITIDVMRIVEESIHPGDIFTIELTVKCSGADAYDLLSSLSFSPTSPLSPISPSIISLGDLGTGETSKTTYTLLASGDISAGQYPATITIGYTSSRGIAKTLTESVTILVDGLIDFDLLDAPSEVAAPGETREMEADLLLVGTESVDFVSIGVVEDNVIKRVSGSDEYIGAVDPDSPIPFDINYRVDPDAPEGDHELKLSVKYRDHLNREHEEQVSLDMEIGKATDNTPQPQEGGFWVWIRRLLGLGP